MVEDVVAGLKLVNDSVGSIKDIVAAIRSGKDYMKAFHPEIKDDVRGVVLELGRSIHVIKQASSVLTNFRFAIVEDALGKELARFNNYFIQSKMQAEQIREHTVDLRSRCSKIREHGKRIGGAATAEGFSKLFFFLGIRSVPRETELGKQLDQLAYNDFSVANAAQGMVECLEFALREVQNALGTQGAMLAANVPAAARILGLYGPAFEEMEVETAVMIKDISALAEGLN